ncbi:GNAT family N-acetyltransferase [Mediterraneibacter glycyrrhizinilyticus]|nr:GNAT family N-acetyltransferase [Mediterraneibacter glycyrrhizinilyticus]MBM6855355.1 GNAT family N-acetyltransferase [Mediterraneibacter glycyrrhizinilyticus]
MRLSTEPITKDSRFWDEVNVLAKEAFPPEEYLPPARLAEMAEADGFDFLALKDGEAFVGFMTVITFENLAYPFFLSIDPSCRSKGYGGRAIETLKAQYPGKKQVVDFEMLDETADNSRQREKRRNFYLRNGYKETGFFLSYLGVEYEVFCMDDDFEPEVFKAMMKTIRVEGFKPKYFWRSDRE